jgi:hypothetical protein
MSYRDLIFVVFGAVIALAVVQVASVKEDNSTARLALQVDNLSGHDLELTAGDGGGVRGVGVVKTSLATTIANFWSPDMDHQGDVYSIGMEVDGRKTVLNLDRSQLKQRQIGSLHVYENGDVLIHLGGSGSMPSVRGLGVTDH